MRWFFLKKSIFAAICCMFILCSCTSRTEYVPLEEIPEAYTLEDAEEDGCVTFEDGNISAGQEIWDEFLSETELGKSADVRLAFNYTLGDPSRYAPELYESMKEEYPKLLIHDLSYDGEAYTLRWFEGEEIVRTYKYLVRYEGKLSLPYALYDGYVRYVLVNDDTVTWKEIEWGVLSSQFDDYIDHYTVYIDYQ